MGISCEECGKIKKGQLIVVNDYGKDGGWLWVFCSEKCLRNYFKKEAGK